MTDRNERQTRFFGDDGQRALAAKRVGIVGCGGNGSHVVQQLAHLEVGALVVIDPDHVTLTGLNRHIGALPQDVTDRTPKVEVSRRVAASITPNVAITCIRDPFVCTRAYDELREVDSVFGCVDDEAVRFVLNEFCLAYSKPYLDLATDIVKDGDSLQYGGEIIVVSPDRPGCLVCRDILDDQEVQLGLGGADVRKQHAELYGVPIGELDRAGPSVVCINGVVASLAVTEFMLSVTGVRPANAHLIYRAKRGGVTIVTDQPKPDCYYCLKVKGQGRDAGVERYLQDEP